MLLNRGKNHPFFRLTIRLGRAKPPSMCRHEITFALTMGMLVIANISNAMEKVPGYVWVASRVPSTLLGKEKNNCIVEAGVQQALILYFFTSQIDIRTYLQGYLAGDKEGFDYNNQLSGGLGAEMVYQPNYWLRFAVGMRYEWEDNLVAHTSFGNTVGYASTDYLWREYESRKGWFVQGQANVRYPSSLKPQEKDSVYARGFLETGYVFWQPANNFLSIGGFLAAGVKAGTRQVDQYNAVDFSPCAKAIIDFHKHLWLELAGGYQWEIRWVSGTELSGVVASSKLVTWW